MFFFMENEFHAFSHTCPLSLTLCLCFARAGDQLYMMQTWCKKGDIPEPLPLQPGTTTHSDMTKGWVQVVHGQKGPKLYPTTKMYLDYSVPLEVLAGLNSKASDKMYKDIQAAANKGEQFDMRVVEDEVSA